MQSQPLHELVGAAVKQCLDGGRDVELDGLGVFRRTSTGVAFLPDWGPRVFIAYVVEDYAYAARLYDALTQAGFHPWLDRKKLLPGQKLATVYRASYRSVRFFCRLFLVELVAQTRPVSV